MRVKTLDIFGFKSFAKKQNIVFDSGMTCVVGPNGCGKSNVVDAIRWVMGEQNARHLRGGTMQDIIFCGSEKKAPLGFAEVTLTLENHDQTAPLEYNNFSEIALTRRLFRNGESEYEINKSRARLKDIVDFFLGTGVGTKAYSIIEQGRVHQIISAKPIERRLIIEEAAGITKYKSRKATAERRIEATKTNLTRIIDIHREIASRVKILAKEKDKLDNINNLRNKIESLDLHQATHKILDQYSQKKFFTQQNNNISQNIQKTEHEALILTTEFEKYLHAFSEKNQKKRLLENLLTQHKNSNSLAQKDLEHIKTRFQDNRIFLQRLESQIHDGENRIEDSQKKLANFKNTQDTLMQEISQQKQILLETQKNGTDVIEKQSNLTKQQNILQKQRLESAQVAAKLQAEMEALKNQEKTNKNNKRELEQEKEQINKNFLETKNYHQRLKAELELGQEKTNKIKTNINLNSEQINNLEKELKLITGQKQELDKKIIMLRTRKSSLSELDKQLAWSESGILALRKSNQASKLQNILADIIKVTPGHEELVETCLHNMLDTGLLESPEHLPKIQEFLQKSQSATTNLLILNQIKPNNISCSNKQTLDNFISIKNNNFANLKKIFENYIIYESLDQSLDNWETAQKEDKIIYSKTGLFLLPNGSVRILGKTNKSGVLKRKQELENLEQIILQEESKLKIAEKSIFEQKSKLSIFIEKRRENNNQLKQTQSGLIRLESNVKQKQADISRLEQDTNKIIKKLEAINLQTQNSEGKLSILKQNWAQELGNHKQIDEELENIFVNKHQIESKFNQHKDEIKIIEIALASLREKSRSCQTQSQQIKENLDHAKSQSQNFSQELSEKEHEQQILQEQERQTNKKIKNLEHEIEQTSKIFTRLIEEVSILQLKKNEHEKKLAKIQQEQKSLEDKLNKNNLQINNTNYEIEKICTQILERYQKNIINYLSDYHHQKLDLPQTQKDIQNFKKTLQRMGSVNENAKVEYEELYARENFLASQIEDLQNALEQLENAIHKINKTTQMRFREAFDHINKQFSQLFPRLFKGGKAELALTEPNNLLASGVEIFAQPPGKKLGSIELMSGGEKALTAISLIMSIFLIKPSPFCILDEVDAPLDEANVARFSQLIKEMSKKTQFIVISHNRKTMESADQLYGVTMEEAGSSKLVMVHVEQAYQELKQSSNLAKKPPKPTQLYLEDIN